MEYTAEINKHIQDAFKEGQRIILREWALQLEKEHETGKARRLRRRADKL